MSTRAAIQGHYAILETTDGELKRSLVASRHYNDYKIGDRAGNIGVWQRFQRERAIW